MDGEKALTPASADEGRQLTMRLRKQRFEEAAAAARRIVHDFGNVLTSILGFSELAQGMVPPGHAVASYLEEIHRAGQLGEQLTHALRLFTRRHWPTEAPARLAAVVRDETRRLRARQSGLAIELAIPSDLPAVAVGAEPLRHVLAQVFDNALEAGGSRPTIRVSARRIALSAEQCLNLLGAVEPGPHVEVSVEDNGCGLSAEAQKRLLVEPFFTTKTRHRGYGLAVAYGILVSHRGALTVEPIPGGTAARAYLPVAPVPAPALGQASAAPLPGERVLVVDDDPQVLQLAQVTLERAGFRVETAGGADEALRTFTHAAEPFALVLSDVVMPRLTGYDLARQLRSHDPGVNMLFMSGELMPDPARPPLPDVPFELIAKPFVPDGLLRAVCSALQRDPRRITVATGTTDEVLSTPA